jgi:hypothetical protein
MARRVEGVGVIQINTNKLAVARFSEFEEELLLLDTVRHPMQSSKTKLGGFEDPVTFCQIL